MILGIGTDITSVERFTDSQAHMDRMANKILTEFEMKEYNNLVNFHDRYLAKKWAAKEAIAKAFGSGIAGDTKWKSIEIRHTSSGQPVVCFNNELKDRAEVLNAKCHLSISDELHTVIAYSVIEY